MVYGPVEGEDEDVAVALEIAIDIPSVRAFPANGSYDFYVYPTGKSTLWVCGDNKGQYVNAMERAGTVVLPEVTVEGTITGDVAGELQLTQDTVVVALLLDGIDDSRIDDSQVAITLLAGDGYYADAYQLNPGALSGMWADGVTEYTFGGISGSMGPQSGDGNGHHDFRIGISGLRYSGLPLADAVVRTDLYSFGRTFTVTGGSILLNTQPAWSSRDAYPVLCDAYPDVLDITWPIAFDASAITEADVGLTLLSQYGDTLTLTPGTAYTVTATSTETTLTLSCIHWAYAPVYTQLRVDIPSAALTWNEQMYAPPEVFTHSYDIASVYSYFVLGGGPSGTASFTYYGLQNLTEPSQIFYPATYTLGITNADGASAFYGEDASGNGMLVESAADGIAFNCDAECNVKLVDQTIYYTRLFDQTEEKTVGGETITFSKIYYNCEALPMPTSQLTDVTPAPGYAFGKGWEEHIKWSWQSFIGTGYQGGTK